MNQRSKSGKKLFINLAVFAITFILCLAIAEGFFRIKDNQPLFGELPTLLNNIHPKLQEKVDSISLELTKERQATALFSLYQVEPEKKTYGRVWREIEEIKKDYSIDDAGKHHTVMRVWNKQFISNLHCGGKTDLYSGEFLRGHAFLYTFNAFDSTQYPVYRYFPNRMNEPEHNRMRFNSFGWGGDSIGFIKPERTIRIAFLGGSTSQQMDFCDFAYPDYIGTWMNEWAKQKGLDVKFEIINTARIAQKSPDFRAIMQYELAPVEPDVVVYYEGRNQLFITDAICDCYPQGFTYYHLLKKSALVRRIAALLGLDSMQQIENAKTNTLKIKNTLLNPEPDITSPHLPIELPTILADLDSIRKINEAINSTFVLCSYAMFTDKEILTTRSGYAAVYSYWMEGLRAIPLDELSLLNTFENRVFETYCRKKNVLFIDVAKNLTRLPEGFMDGIHLNCEGMKYHAWIVFLDLLPVIEQQLKNGLLPKKSNQKSAVHPYLHDTFEKVTFPYQCD